MSIQMNNLMKRFGEKEVLRSISLSIEGGELFGLLGPSGAGKTTLIRILLGQLEQTEGSATLLGCDTRHLTGKTYAKIGSVLDELGLYDRLTCYDNLKLFTELYQIPKTRIPEVLKKVGLLEAKKKPVMKLSKGMKQRLVLARAIMIEPKLLFLDEPTSGLDPTTAAEIHALILEQKEKGTTIFLTTHNMEEATKLCDHVALLCDGKIVEYGPPKEICRKYNAQQKIEVLLRNGEMVSIRNNRMAGEIIKEYLEQEMIETIHSTEPNLETVFMEVTGRGLN